MNQPPLNTDAIRAAFDAVQAIDGPASIGSMEIVEVAVSAYLAAALPEVTSAKASAWEEGFQAGWEEHEDPGAFVNDYWDAKTPNPYLPEES